MRLFIVVKSGFTLVEILMGMAISSIVFLGALNFLSNTVNTDEYQKEMMFVQNESSFALDYMVTDLRMAGFVISNEINTLERQPIDWALSGDAVVAGNDRMAVQYENFNNNTDCNGNIPADDIVNQYAVDINGILTCNNTVLLDNVVSFQVLYGMDINDDGRIDRYLKTGNASIGSQDGRYKVIATKIDMIVRSARGFGNAYEKRFRIMGEPELVITDNFIYRKYTRTVFLKNMI
jgi:type IV pilus assembly protein PilW